MEISKLLNDYLIFLTIYLFSLDGTITTSFNSTPPMSSYLLAFVISDLEFISNAGSKLPSETLHRVWVRKDYLSKAQFALDNSVDVLKALENFVNFNFSMPKIDSAGVPNKGGAMENWGMIIYRFVKFQEFYVYLVSFIVIREDDIVHEVNVEDIAHSQKLSGLTTISHELAHQFFGNLVTCEWWDQFW